jgi:hypothetical protein
MEHAMVKDENGTPFCICGMQPTPGLHVWAQKGEVLHHIVDARRGGDWRV